mmetsp:Transcript_38156/g.109493  ORF Transcript_38156/g.109493 Transcript_38156/m.109493 type:complete len:494 (+) Transcript_38156:26-1507(+)
MARLRRGATALALAALGCLPAARAQIKILAPDSLAAQFAQTHGIVYGTTATFGAPFYGERVMGQLLYGESKGRNHCTADDYTLPTPPAHAAGSGSEGEAQEIVNVVLVRRGGCTFVTKVLTAQKMGAHAVIVVDKESSELTSEQIQKIVMADDGFGSPVKIPSVLVSKTEGKKLIDAARAGSVLVELAWDIPRGEVVLADFWMSSGSRESAEFLQRFKESAETLMYHLQFVPHYHIFSLPGGQSYNHLCAEQIDSCPECRPSPDKYCAPDPDGPGPVTGGDVANEDLRQACIWNTTAKRVQYNGAAYSQEFWDYAVRFNTECPLAGKSADRRFGYACSKRTMEEVGIAVQAVENCVRRNFKQILQDQIEQVAWSPQALRLNGWRYSGPLDPETVLKAVCSGFANPPKECDELLNGYSSVVQWSTPSLTFRRLLTTIFVMGLVLSAVFFLYRRHVTSSVRRVLREEVMLEVQTQMADYTAMDDGPGHKRGTLSF